MVTAISIRDLIAQIEITLSPIATESHLVAAMFSSNVIFSIRKLYSTFSPSEKVDRTYLARKQLTNTLRAINETPSQTKYFSNFPSVL